MDLNNASDFDIESEGAESGFDSEASRINFWKDITANQYNDRFGLEDSHAQIPSQD
jgi:hypothetical protein